MHSEFSARQAAAANCCGEKLYPEKQFRGIGLHSFCSVYQLIK
jgi:hypothetical protein